MRPSYKLEEVTTISGEVRFRVWRMKWFGLKKAELKSEFNYYDSAKMSIDILRENIIVKKKFID